MGTEDSLEKQKQLKESLSALLDRPSVEAGEVLRMASELARLDEQQVWFSVDAGLVHRLGTELVARQETALAELIKNGYDADATKVEVVFDMKAEPGGVLTIEDDGHGMTREQLVAGFMRISTADKIHQPTSPRYHRQRAGRKGIGRFAAQRLGERLTLITQTEEQPFALRVEIDWSRFSHDRELLSIGSKITTFPKERSHGTTLLIHNLRDPWSDAKVERTYRYVMDLLQPPLDEGIGEAERYTLSDGKAEDPGFVARILWENASGDLNVADEHSMFLDHRVAAIEGWVDEEEVAWCKIKSSRYHISDQFRIDTSGESPRKYSELVGVRLNANYFIADKEHVSGLLLNRVRDTLAEFGGIRLYRNGFRVQPYGEKSDDWLGLAASSSKRTVLVPHANKNFYGFISISDVEGQRFNETSSREGLIENAAFEQLRKFGYQVLVQAATRIGVVRGRKVRTNDGPREKPANKAREIADQIAGLTERTAPSAEGPGQLSTAHRSGAVVMLGLEKAQEIAAELQAVADAHEREVEEYLKELGMLRVLASLGLLIGQFTHEVRHDLVALAADVSVLKRDDMPENARQIAARLGENLNSLRVFAAYFDHTIADNVRRDLRPQDLREAISRFRRVVESRAVTQSLTLDVQVKGASLVTRPMHPSEWASVLFNLFTNAEKAIRKARTLGKVLIRAGRNGEQLFVEFADNGCGIPDEYRERVFDAFFTTTAAADPGSPEVDHAQGTGLGLKIVRDIITSADGTVRVVEAPAGYRTCIRIEVPAARLQKGA